MDQCIFCKIAAGEIPAKVVYEDDQLMAFQDINPLAPVHILIIPKKHLEDLVAVTEEETEMLGKIVLLARKLAEEQGIASAGFRLVNNCRKDGGQEVFHLHFHLLGGTRLGRFA